MDHTYCTEPYARRIPEQFSIATFFDDVFAPMLDDRVTTKSVLVRTALAGGTHQQSDLAMIGDRAEDIIAPVAAFAPVALLAPVASTGN